MPSKEGPTLKSDREKARICGPRCDRIPPETARRVPGRRRLRLHKSVSSFATPETRRCPSPVVVDKHGLSRRRRCASCFAPFFPLGALSPSPVSGSGFSPVKKVVEEQSNPLGRMERGPQGGNLKPAGPRRSHERSSPSRRRRRRVPRRKRSDRPSVPRASRSRRECAPGRVHSGSRGFAPRRRILE